MSVQSNSCNALPLQEALDQAHMSRLDLASAIGVDPVTVWRWTTGKSVPRSEPTRRAVSDAVGRTILWPDEQPQAAA